jgi:hypothetical protein
LICAIVLMGVNSCNRSPDRVVISAPQAATITV